MMTNREFTSNRGITLVALIITIIVLIILAAVTIKIAFDTNFTKLASDATENYTRAQFYDSEHIDNTVSFLEETLSNLISNKVNYK